MIHEWRPRQMLHGLIPKRDQARYMNVLPLQDANDVFVSIVHSLQPANLTFISRRFAHASRRPVRVIDENARLQEECEDPSAAKSDCQT